MTSHQLGQCCNKSCPFAGSCQAFYAVDGMNLSGMNPLPLKCLCGCFGMQHAPGRRNGEDLPEVQPTEPNPPPPPSQTSTSTSSVPLAQPPPHDPDRLQSFLGGARVRAERQANSGQSSSTKFTFDPSSQIYAQQWTKQTNQLDPSKKRKTDTASQSASKRTKSKSTAAASTIPPSETPAPSKPAKGVKTWRFNLALYPRVSPFYRSDRTHATVPQPTPHGYSLLVLERLFVLKEVSENISSFELSYEISSAFKTNPYIKDHYSQGFIEGWRLLGRVDGKKGCQGKFVLFDTVGDITLNDLKLAVVDHRTKKYKNTVFIILPQGSEDIPIDSEFYGSQSHSSDAEGDSGGNDHKDDDNPKDSHSSENPNPPLFSKASDSEHVTSTPPHSKDTTSPLPDKDAPTPGDTEFQQDEMLVSFCATIQLLHRLTINIDGNKSLKAKFYWWPIRASDEYITLHGVVKTLDAKCQRLEAGKSSYRTVPSLVEETVEELAPVLDFILSLDKLDDRRGLFEQYFRLGPFGLAPAIDYLFRLSIFLIKRTKQGSVTFSDTSDCFDKLNTIAAPLLSLVLDFRSMVPRIQYDPPGFSDFRASLKSSEKYFGEATVKDRPHILDLKLGSSDLNQYHASIKKDFGCSHDHLRMNNRYLLYGPNGLEGILALASFILDDLPDDDPEYIKFFSLFQQFCGALAQKVTNWKKSTSAGKAKEESKSRATTAEPEHSKRDDEGSAGKRRGYPTRSQNANKNEPYSDSDSNSDSLPREYNPNSEERSKFDTNQKRKKTQKPTWVEIESDESSEYFPTPAEECERRQQNKRPKFDYPKSEKRREYTARSPPPNAQRPKATPKPRPKPKPRKPTDLPIFEALTLPHLSFADFVERLLTKCPHPHPNDRIWDLGRLSEFSQMKPITQC